MAHEYLNNTFFEKAITDYRKAVKNKKKNHSEFIRAQTVLTEAFRILVENLIRGFKFKLIDNDDALQEGIMICFEKLPYFDKSRGGAFNLYTTIILNHFKQLYRTAKSFQELKFKYLEHLSKKQDEDLGKPKNKKNIYKNYYQDDEFNYREET